MQSSPKLREGNPLAQVHREREAKIIAESMVDVPEPERINALRTSLASARRELDLRTLLHNGGRLRRRRPTATCANC